MAAAHMDEIGFIVRHIDDKGFLRILPLGGFDPKTLTAQRVIVHGTKDLLGCMGAKPIHVMTPAERAKMPEVTDFFVDLGLPKEEVEKYVSVGDAITRERELTEMGDCINVKSSTTAPDATSSSKPSAPSKLLKPSRPTTSMPSSPYRKKSAAEAHR